MTIDILKAKERSITRRQALKIAAFSGAGALLCGTALAKSASHPDTSKALRINNHLKTIA